jgi:lysophospholipase L1-like esterase
MSSFVETIKKWGAAILVSAALMTESCKTQSYSWNTEQEYYKLSLWHKRVRSYKKIKYPVHTCTLFIGDSITEGYDLKHFYNDSNIANMGISGDFTSGVLDRLNHAKRLQPKKIFLMIGINDILKLVPFEKTKSNYSAIIDYIKKECPETKFFIQSNLPTDYHVVNNLPNDTILQYVNDLNIFLRAQCEQKGATFIDMYSKFESDKKVLQSVLTYDGLHLSYEGYKVWTEVISGYVKES